MSAKRTSWNEFSSSMASAIICPSTSRKFKFSKYIFDSLVRNVDSPTKFYMYPRFLQLMIRKQVGDLLTHTTKYSSPALTQKVFANMRRVGKGCSGVETPLFEGMIVEQQVDEGADEVHDEGVLTAGVVAGVVSADDERMIDDMDADVDVSLEDAKEVVVEKSADVDESAVVQGRKAYATITTAASPTLTTTPCAARRRKGVVIRDPQESSTPSIVIHFEAKSKDNAGYTSLNLEKSKKCSWSSEGQELEVVRVLWCEDYHIQYNTVDFAGRKEISTHKVHSGSDAK
uniref:Uncharacterized protein n=1 Tax=Tanacetum cinerariifolium TaxID=118510 RepID=A0A699IQB9_TANCI|nr:hypothetical protein [Tanacetum cinerariifolium]